MSFNSNPPRAEYVAEASQTVFPFVFKIYTDSNLVVYKTVGSADPVLLLLTTDYTATINGDAGGEITLLVGVDEGDVITILRDLPITRDTEYQTSGDLLADTLNIDQEYQTYLIADQNDQIAAIEAGEAGVSSFVQRTGDTMTGQLKGITPVSNEDFTRKDYVDNADGLRVLKTGDTMTGQLSGITPASDANLARKDYVDGITAIKLNASGDTPMYACRAWVNFNGTGTVAIRESGNVSSITDNGTGDYTINFATSMEDVNYSYVCGGYEHTIADTPAYGALKNGATPATSSINIGYSYANATDIDVPFATVTIFR